MAHSKQESKNAKFFISKEDWKKVIAYAESSYHQFKAEIGGQLVVIEDKDGDFILKDPVILKQTVSGGNCEMEEEALALHYAKMVKKYGDKVRHCWWHSHHTMGAFWSGTDDNTILENETQDFSVSLVVNLKQEYKLRVQFFYPFEHEENVTLNFLDDEVERNEEIDNEVKELCSANVVIQQMQLHNGINNQASLWTNQDQEEVDLYNYGFKTDKPDISLVPDKTWVQVEKKLEEVQDSIVEGNCSYEQFLEIRKDINRNIEQYNVRVKYLDRNDFMVKPYAMWPEDFVENINGGTNLAN